jgi:hypothetical protein
MPRVRTKIAVTGFTESELSAGLPDFREYLDERLHLITPKVDWDAEQKVLLVTVETEGIDPHFESEATFDEVWDCVCGAFNPAGTISFDILEAQLLSP